MRAQVLAELQEVGAVGVQRVAREPALELEVGEEVEHEAREAAIDAALHGGGQGGLDGDRHGTGFGPGSLQPLAAQGTVRGRPGGAAASSRFSERSWPAARGAAKKRGSSSIARPMVRGRQARAGVGGELDAGRAQAVAALRGGLQLGPRLGQSGEALGVGHRDVDRGQQELEHGPGVVAEVQVAPARVGAGEAGRERRRESQGERRVSALEGDDAAVAVLGAGADDPRARARPGPRPSRASRPRRRARRACSAPRARRRRRERRRRARRGGPARAAPRRRARATRAARRRRSARIRPALPACPARPPRRPGQGGRAAAARAPGPPRGRRGDVPPPPPPRGARPARPRAAARCS